MVIHNPIIPFYLMEKAKEFQPGRPPANPKQEVAGLKEAIEATRKRIAEYKSGGADVSDLEFHLKSLEQHLENAQKKVK